MSNLNYRSCEHSDINYILATWTRSYRDEQMDMKEEDYYIWEKERIARCSRSIIILSPKEEPSLIWGWASFEKLIVPGDVKNILHYIYIKKPYRNNGFATQILQKIGTPDIITHITNDYRKYFSIPRYIPLS